MSRPSHPFTVKHRDVWRIALPATIAFITEPLAGVVDITVIGRLGEANLLGGMALGTLAFNFIFGMCLFLRMGTAGLVAQSVGAKDVNDGLSHFARAASFGALIGVVLIVLIPVVSFVAGVLLAPDANTITPFHDYLWVRMLSGPMVLINFALLGWFYGRGAASTGMMLQFIVHGSNIVFSVLFVYGFGWGVAGVALGTLVGESLATIVGFVLVIRHFGSVGAVLKRIPFASLIDTHQLRRMLALSRDLLIRSAALQGAFAVFTAMVSREGTLALAANAVVLQFLYLSGYFLDGLAQSSEQLCGKAVGANYRPAFVQALKLSLIWGYIVGAGFFLLCLVAGGFVIDFMTTAPDVRALAHSYLIPAAFTAVTGVLAFVMDGVMTGATLNTIIRNGMVSAFLVFLAAVIVLQPLFGMTGLWLSMHVLFIARGVIFWFAVRWKTPSLFAEPAFETPQATRT